MWACGRDVVGEVKNKMSSAKRLMSWGLSWIEKHFILMCVVIFSARGSIRRLKMEGKRRYSMFRANRDNERGQKHIRCVYLSTRGT